jgi:hypothetical protein
MYHALGACRATLATTFFIAATDIGLKHLHQFEHHEPYSLYATLAAVGLTLGAEYTIEVNRRDARRTIVAQLGGNLRAWCLRNRSVLVQLAGGTRFRQSRSADISASMQSKTIDPAS